MKLLPIRTAKDEELPWSRNTMYKYSAQNRYPKILIKVDGKLFIDMDAFYDLARNKRDAQIKKSVSARRGLEA